MLVRKPFLSTEYCTFGKKSGMLTKVQLLKTINDLPDEIAFDDLLDRLIILQKVETGLDQSGKGKTKSTEEAKEILKEWLS
jgi:hypothetical protein